MPNASPAAGGMDAGDDGRSCTKLEQRQLSHHEDSLAVPRVPWVAPQTISSLLAGLVSSDEFKTFGASFSHLQHESGNISALIGML